MAEKWIPHSYQRQGISWLIKHPEAALFWAPGLGKSSVTLAAFQALRKSGGCKKALVIAPLRVCYRVWSKDADGEIGKWENFQDLKISLLHGKDKADALDQDSTIYVINPDGLGWLIESGGLRSLGARGVDTLIVDELSKFKHTSTKRFKLMKPHLGKFRRRWGLTGSPAANGLLDLFGQVFMLDLGSRLGKFITHYRFSYFLPTGFGGHEWKSQADAEKRIYGKLKDLALTMKAEDHLDLPPLVEQNLWVDLPPKARKVYDALEEDLLVQLDDGTLTAVNAAVASLKCRQVASGGGYLDQEDAATLMQSTTKQQRKSTVIHDAKTEALVDLVEELQGQPLLVGYEFIHDLERIRAALGNVPAINGQTSGKDTMEIIRAWKAGELPVLCGHPAAMGHGLNLQGSSSHLAWYTLTWDQELYDQTVRRIYRQGTNATRVFVHRILARKTVDEDVARALASKQRVQDALFEGLKSRRRGRQ